MNTTIREALPGDTNALLKLMRGLAEFEGYLDRFAVDEAALKHHAFKKKSFTALVAEQYDKQIAGMLVYYFLPFTYDLTPWLFIKELYVEPEFRGQAIGEQLLQTAALACEQRGGQKMVWSVLANNTQAQRFYQRLGAKHDVAWLPFGMNNNSIKALTNRALTSDSNRP